MGVPDDAFQLIRDLSALERKARQLGDDELSEIVGRVASNASHVAERVGELWEELREQKQLNTEEKNYELKKKTSFTGVTP